MNRRLAQMTGDPAASPGPPAVTWQAAPSWRHCPHLAAGQLACPLSWRDQFKKGRLTIYLDTSAVDRQVDQLQGIAATVAVGVLVGAVMIASAIELVFQQHAPHYLVKTAQIAFTAALAIVVVLVVAYLGQMFRCQRRNQCR